MLQLHDAAKSDLEYQRSAPRLEVGFPAGSTWIVFTDEVVHAATAGQFAFEQTLYLDVEGMRDRSASPLAVLEDLTGRRLESVSVDASAAGTQSVTLGRGSSRRAGVYAARVRFRGAERTLRLIALR